MESLFSKTALLENTFLRHVEIFERLGSTQDQAFKLCSSDQLNLPAMVVAKQQSAGRGRDGSSWWSPKGALLFSLIVPLPQRFAQPENSSQFSLAIAYAVAEYLQVVLQPSGNDQTVRVKPPNDIYIADAKIAGILIDVPHHPDQLSRRAILGIGLNVNNDGSDRPPEIKVPVTSISDQTGDKFDLQESLIALLKHLEGCLEPTEE